VRLANHDDTQSRFTVVPCAKSAARTFSAYGTCRTSRICKASERPSWFAIEGLVGCLVGKEKSNDTNGRIVIIADGFMDRCGNRSEN